MGDKIEIVKARRDRNEGHGHVYTRPDGVRTRCGGPKMCKECAKDMAELQSMFIKQGSADHVKELTDRLEKAEARKVIETLLKCPAIADVNHRDPTWGCEETAQAEDAALAWLEANRGDA